MLTAGSKSTQMEYPYNNFAKKALKTRTSICIVFRVLKMSAFEVLAQNPILLSFFQEMGPFQPPDMAITVMASCLTPNHVSASPDATLPLRSCVHASASLQRPNPQLPAYKPLLFTLKICTHGLSVLQPHLIRLRRPKNEYLKWLLLWTVGPVRAVLPTIFSRFLVTSFSFS